MTDKYETIERIAAEIRGMTKAEQEQVVASATGVEWQRVARERVKTQPILGRVYAVNEFDPGYVDVFEEDSEGFIDNVGLSLENMCTMLAGKAAVILYLQAIRDELNSMELGG